MSGTAHTQSESRGSADRPQYAPYDWWYATGAGLVGTDGTDSDEPDDEREWGLHHDEKPGTSKAAWLAHNLLKNSDAPLYCPVSKDEDDVLEQMTDPEVYVERSVVIRDRDEADELTDGEKVETVDLAGRVMYADHRRYRYSELSGHISGPLIGDQPKEDFLEVVDAVLNYAQADVDVSLRESTADRIRSLACVFKTDDDRRKPDVKIMEDVVRCIENPDRLDDLGF